MSGSASDYADLKLLELLVGKTAFAKVDPMFLALCTTLPTVTSTGATLVEANYTGYARLSVAASNWGAAALVGGLPTISNTGVLTFAYTSGSSTIVGVALVDALTNGNVHAWASVTSKLIDGTNNPPTFQAASITLTSR